MVQDYARSARRHRQQIDRERQKNAVSKRLMLITLLAALAFGCFLYYLTQIQPELTADSRQPAPDNTPLQQQPAASQANESPAASNGYDFYTLLPESEVVAPEVDAYTFKDKQSDSAREVYMLQAGSFKNGRDADRLRAKLILEGLTVKVSRVTNSKGQLWHRVLAGPFTSRSSLNQAQDILANANTESMLIKVQ